MNVASRLPVFTNLKGIIPDSPGFKVRAFKLVCEVIETLYCELIEREVEFLAFSPLF